MVRVSMLELLGCGELWGLRLGVSVRIKAQFIVGLKTRVILLKS